MALKRGTVKLEDYNSNWKKEYEEEAKLLKKVLKDKIIEIYHVGSTSIEGLKSKPIIDILITINSLRDFNEIENILHDYDYGTSNNDIPDRMFIAKGPDEARSHYLHFTTKYSNTYYDLLYFKKYLIEHPEYIKQYSDLKEDLGSKYPNERSKYTKGKHDFISNVVKLAKEEYM